MSKFKNILLNNKRLGDYSKNDLIRVVVQSVDAANKYEGTAKLLFVANKKLKAQNEYWKKQLRDK